MFPYWLVRKWALEDKDYLLSYIHPRDLDAGQPVIKGLPLSRRFKSYVGIKHAEEKLRRFLTEFKFTDLATGVQQYDWDKARIINL